MSTTAEEGSTGSATTAPARGAGARQGRRAAGTAGAMLVGVVVGVAGMLLAFRVFGGALEDGAAKAALRERFGPWRGLVAAAGGLALIWLGIAVHEAGHVIGGALARFRFVLWVVGPVRIDRDERERVRVRLNRDLSLAGGVAGMMPTTPEALRRRLALLVAGGPVASLVVGGAALLAAGTLPADAPLARGAVILLGVLSLLLGVVTSVPTRAGGFTSDGGRLLRLLRGGPAAEREGATMSLIALLTAGVRPREWPPTLVATLAALEDGTTEECYAHVLAYYHALDAGDVRGAGAHLDRFMALRGTFPPAFAPGLDVEAAYFEARHRAAPARARELLAAVPARTAAVKGYDRARAEAAIALAAGDEGEARALAERALAGPMPPAAAFSRARLEELRVADARLRGAAGNGEVAVGR